MMKLLALLVLGPYSTRARNCPMEMRRRFCTSRILAMLAACPLPLPVFHLSDPCLALTCAAASSSMARRCSSPYRITFAAVPVPVMQYSRSLVTVVQYRLYCSLL